MKIGLATIESFYNRASDRTDERIRNDMNVEKIALVGLFFLMVGGMLFSYGILTFDQCLVIL